MIDLTKIKRTLEKERCRDHGENPDVTIKGDKINIKACCEKFRDELEKVLDKMIDQSMGSGSSEIV